MIVHLLLPQFNFSIPWLGQHHLALFLAGTLVITGTLGCQCSKNSFWMLLLTWPSTRRDLSLIVLFLHIQIISKDRAPNYRNSFLCSLSSWSDGGGSISNSIKWDRDWTCHLSILMFQWLPNHIALAMWQWVNRCRANSDSTLQRGQLVSKEEENSLNLSLVGRRLNAILQRCIFSLSWMLAFHIFFVKETLLDELPPSIMRR